MSDITEFLKSNQRFLKLASGEKFTGIYLGAKMIPDKFKIMDDPKALTILYTFRTPEDKVLEFTCGNKSLALGFEKAENGQEFTIEKTGSGKQTFYKVTLGGKEKLPF